MSRWQTKPLGEMCSTKSGNSKMIKGKLPSQNNGKLFPAYSATGQDVFSDGFDFEGDGIVISAVGARCGKCFLASGKWRAIANTHVVLPKPEKANVRFLWYLLNDESFWVKGGAAQPFVKVGDSLKKLIPAPPLAEQERIVKLLDEADELRKLRTQADQRTDALIPALFHEIFGNLFQNRNAWPERCLEDIVAPGRIVTYGIVQAGPNIPNGVPYIRTGDLKEGVIRTEGLMRTSHEIAANYRRSEITTGDIVMSIRATVGTTAIVPLELNGANLTQGTARISPGAATLTDFLLWFLRMPETQSWIQGQVKGATFREITLGALRKLPVLIPPMSLQEKFSKRVTEIRDFAGSQSDSRQRLDDLFQSMLHRAFNGEL